jgi:hypothetical protein
VYRRIELINHKPYTILEDGTKIDEPSHYKGGIMVAGSSEEVTNEWIKEDGLRGPWGKRNTSIPPNAKFYFTELGWKKIGRNVVAACIRTGQEYIVRAIKETDANVVWRDYFTNYEVAVQPKKKRN